MLQPSVINICYSFHEIKFLLYFVCKMKNCFQRKKTFVFKHRSIAPAQRKQNVVRKTVFNDKQIRLYLTSQTKTVCLICVNVFLFYCLRTANSLKKREEKNTESG